MTVDPKLAEIVVCPEDRGPLLLVGDVFYNPRLRRAYPIIDGIPMLLADSSRLVDDTEHERLVSGV